MKTGCYLLIMDGTVVYVGATTNWPNRLSQHKEIDFNECKLIQCSYEELFSNERRLIQTLKPKYNVREVVNLVRKPVSDFVRSNIDRVKLAFEKGTELQLSEEVKKNLNYSSKTNARDVSFVILRHFCNQRHVTFDWDKRKFEKKKK